MRDYLAFLESRTQSPDPLGFEPLWMPDFLFPFQRDPVEWAIRKGRGLIAADCGLGKGPMQFVIAENVIRKTNRPVLYLTTLGDSLQTIEEAAKFGVDAIRSKDGKFPAGARLIVTNYERLEHFNPADFAGVTCNESSCIKDFDGKRSGQVVEFLRTVPYRFLCTATASPNDHMELGTSSEALGGLGYMDMLARFFKSDDGSLHPFRNYPRGAPKKPGAVWSFKPHAEPHFWRWVCSWARAFRKPSDLGFSDDGYDLPEHEIRDHVVKASRTLPGTFLEFAARGLREQREEQKRTLEDRCGVVVDLLADADSAVAWCHLNDEGNRLAREISGAVQVGSGSQSDDEKEELFAAFTSGQARVMVTKPKIAGLGLNWQHCHRQTYFPSHSFEQYYQAVRRLWRFGQHHKVTTDLVTTDGGVEIIENLARKAAKAERQYTQLVALMNEGWTIDRAHYGTKTTEVAPWLASISV